MLRLTQASPLRLLKKDGINTCLTVGGERVQPLLHILGNSKQRALMLTSLPIYIGPSKRMQHLSTLFQINVCSAYGKNILFYMNHGMLHSTLLYNIVQTQYCTAFIYVDIPSSVRQNIQFNLIHLSVYFYYLPWCIKGRELGPRLSRSQGIQLHHFQHQLCVAGESEGNCWQRTECFVSFVVSVYRQLRSELFQI